MFKNLLVKIIKTHWAYKDMRRERDIAINKFKILTEDYLDLQERLNIAYDENTKQHKIVVKYINKILKLVKNLDANNTTKEIKKLCYEVKNNV